MLTVNGFSRDILFLQSAARLLGDLFQSASDIIAPDTIAQVSTSNEVAHGVANGDVEIPQASGDVPLPLTIIKQFDAYARFMKAYRTPIEGFKNTPVMYSIRAAIREALTSEITDFRLKRIDWNKVLPSNDMRVGGYEASGIKSIVRSLVANAEKHSSLPDDEFRCFILERGIFRYLVLKYTSRHRLAPIEVIREFGLKPLLLNGRISYGAFLLASRVRAMDGVMHIKRPIDDCQRYLPLELVIALPLRGKDEADNDIYI